MAVWREADGWHGELKMARVTSNKFEGALKSYVLQRSSKHTVLLLVHCRWFCEDCFQEALFVDVTGNARQDAAEWCRVW